ncbi:hypothetical protein N7471_012938 [Penicillium samsonianum]|uniref:uncharacterized protein n=1 Tax=Penicillium samsonianum TaxID=1882272 RepID=UPI002548EF88|nr:uncharacterized protein N7471_012938 [Penicillium samsonianum]KAJ6125621.1 hypothetical protein N7471_012938 [Penicillium samsonianum]
MASNAAYHLKEVEDKAFIQVNTLLLDVLNAKVKASPSRDMTDLLESKAKTYPMISYATGSVALVATSEVIWHLGSTAVLGLNPEIVMKAGNDIDIHHIHTLDYIKHHAPRVPIPDIHGILQHPESNRIFLLMSRAPGEQLDSTWKFLGEDAKASIREQFRCDWWRISVLACSMLR